MNHSARSGDAELDDLGIADRLAGGGQGTVYRLSRPDGMLLKLYHHDVEVDAAELARLIHLPAAMSGADRRLVTETTAWPTGRVFRDGRCVGLLMGEVPARFATRLAGRRCLQELQFLLYPRRAMWAELVLPSGAERCWLAVHYLRLFAALHRNGVVVGDVSLRNLLWTLAGGPSVFAIDCDGFRIAGRPPPVRPVDTAGWADPSAGSGAATLDSDRYKLALLTVRLLLGDHRVRPEDVGTSTAARAVLGPELTALAARAARPGRRPKADSWELALTGRNADFIQRLSGLDGHSDGGSGSPANRSRPGR
jgi:DNA-binding helix-hairpin-helix protein with protein kinase domain